MVGEASREGARVMDALEERQHRGADQTVDHQKSPHRRNLQQIPHDARDRDRGRRARTAETERGECDRALEHTFPQQRDLSGTQTNRIRTPVWGSHRIVFWRGRAISLLRVDSAMHLHMKSRGLPTCLLRNPTIGHRKQKVLFSNVAKIAYLERGERERDTKDFFEEREREREETC